MKKIKATRETRKQALRKRLEREAQRLQGRQADATNLDEKVSAVYRRMSNLDPNAFIVVTRDCHDGKKVAVHGLSHEVSRGIETDGLHFRLEKSFADGRSDYLLIEVDGECCSESSRLVVCLESGQRTSVFLGRGSFPTHLDIFFSLSNKDAEDYATQAKKSFAKKA